MASTHIDYRKIDYDQLIDKPITRVASGVNPNTLTTAGVYDRGDGNRFIVTVDGQNITQVIEEKDGYQTRSSTDGGTTWTTWDEVEFSKSGDIDAEDVNYDNTTSGLTATNVQDAIDEIDTSVDTINTTITNIQTDITEIKDIVEVETMPTPGEESEGTIIQYKGATTSTFTHGYFYECVGDGQDPETFSRVNIQVQDNPAQAEVMPTPSAENVGQIIQYAGDTNNYYTHAHFYEVIEDPENPGQYIYKEVEVQDSPAQSEDMPEADEDSEGTIIQYIGETDANFTHGYFYECVSDGQDPATYSWVNVEVQDYEKDIFLTQAQYDALPAADKANTKRHYYIYTTTGSGPVIGGDDVGYDNTTSGLIATTVQDAIDEIADKPTSLVDLEDTTITTPTNDEVLSYNSTSQKWENKAYKSSTSVTLTTAGWSNKVQTVNATGVTANNVVVISPAPSSIDEYSESFVYCSAQGSGTLTFTCKTTPSSAITVNVLILN